MDIHENKIAADCVFAMLLCARVFILKRFMDPHMGVAWRRWVLLQVMPPRSVMCDIFTNLFQSLRSADTDDMLNLVNTMLKNLFSCEDLFPVAERVNNTTPLFVVIDKAQVAADNLSEYFCFTNKGTDLRPILHTFYR